MKPRKIVPTLAIWTLAIWTLAIWTLAISGCTRATNEQIRHFTLTPTPSPIPSRTPDPSQTPTEVPQPITTQPAPRVAKVMVTAVQFLNVREFAGADQRILFVLLNNSEVVVIGSCTHAGWVEIEYQGKNGWVNADYLEKGVCDG